MSGDTAMLGEERLATWIERLATFNTDPTAGGVTREVYEPAYRDACRYVSGLMMEAELEVREDAFGNIYGLWEGTDPHAPRVLTGSHFDTTLNAGKYDGSLGVLGAIDAVRRLREAGVDPRRGIEVVGFAGEEPRFGLGCIGSRAAVGELDRQDLDRLRDRNGMSLASALRAAGLDPDRLRDAKLEAGRYSAFLELHIEQGAVLETGQVPVGVVTRIAAPHDLLVRFHGEAMHAGATPMRLRRDALAGAAEAMVELERLASSSVSSTTVATVGVIRALPGAINVIPGQVEMEVDVRDSDGLVRTQVVEAFLDAAEVIAARRGLDLSHEVIARHAPAACDEPIVDAARRACTDLGVDYLEITSGAYHDAMVLSSLMPMGMIFVPSVGGISHSPLEYTDPDDISRGVQVLARALTHLAA
ncbi:MAG: M20 family metallo-hydrolase [Solirubrobacteraceae bacterium]